jgi:hypothetical protein
VTYRAGSLANTVTHYLVSSGFSTLYAALGDHLPDIVESRALDWIENCADERINTLRRCVRARVGSWWCVCAHVCTPAKLPPHAPCPPPTQSAHLSLPAFASPQITRLSYIEYANKHILKILTIPADELDSIIESLETDIQGCTASGSGLEAAWPNQVRG